MKRIALVALMGLPLLAADAHMTAEERTKVMNWLDESRKEFLASIDGVTEEQWKWKPAPERWSVGETAEHIVLAEALLYGTVQKAIASPPNPAWEEKTKGKTEFIERVMAPRLGKASAPEPIIAVRQTDPGRSPRDVSKAARGDREIRERDAGGAETVHRGTPVSGVRNPERVSVADLRPSAYGASR